MPVADVPATVAYLENEVGLPLWDGDRRGFTALGDDHGLAIVVPAGRPCFPPTRPAAALPLSLTIAGDDADQAIRLPSA